MGSELALINEIKKWPCVYDFTLPSYTRKDCNKKAWAVISAKTKTSVHECKEKWRNIRSSFLRSLKPSSEGCKPKKPYYLKRDLEFIMPFMKPMKNTPQIPSEELCHPVGVGSEEATGNEEDPFTDIHDILELNNFDDDESNSVDVDINDSSSPFDEAETLQEDSAGEVTSKVPIAEENRNPRNLKRHPNSNENLEKTLNLYFKSKIRRLEDTRTGTSCVSATPGLTFSSSFSESSDNGLRLFLMSLLPDLETMTADQIRTFKIKVMVLIDSMKSGGKDATTPTTPSLDQSSYNTEASVKEEYILEEDESSHIL